MRLLQSPVTMLFSDDNEQKKFYEKLFNKSAGLFFSTPPPLSSRNCSPSSISQHHHNALALRPGTDGRRSAGPTVSRRQPSVNSNNRQQQMASLMNFGPIVQRSSYHIADQLLTQKSNTLIRVARASATVLLLFFIGGGERRPLLADKQPATGKLAVATTRCDWRLQQVRAVVARPAVVLLLALLKLLQQPASAAGNDHIKEARIGNVPSSSATVVVDSTVVSTTAATVTVEMGKLDPIITLMIRTTTTKIGNLFL
ncbi:hypothetical protein niasHT_018865 [Heterodera trifolii]|uniref:Uncharacterized protein n=1 Tax=Heterodera trifolii TaxID=157864 RepID=A0ABD2L528_9BILA